MKNKIFFLLICLLLPLLNPFQIQARELETIEKNELEPQIKDARKQSISSSDIAPLFKAIAKLLSEDRYQIESEMLLTGDAPGIQFISNIRIKTITEAPNKFNSEITFFSPNGLSGKQYKIISDGERVWIHDVMKNQYSVSSYQRFIDSNDDFLIGAVSFFYLSLQSDSENANIYGKFLNSLSEERLIDFLESELNIDKQQISLREETINNNQFKIYRIDDRKKNLIFDFFLDPILNEVKIISLSGKQSGLDITIKEKVNSSFSPLSLPRQTFRFSLPMGIQKVEQPLEISPF